MSTRRTDVAATAGSEILVDGSPLAPEVQANLAELRVDDSVALPTAFLISLNDPGLELVDTHPLMVGAEVEIRMAGPGGRGLVSVMKGKVSTVAPEFRRDGVTIHIRGFDRSHELNRIPVTKTYQDVTVGDIAQQIAGDAGLTADVTVSGGGAHAFVQQSDETDWDFLWRLARSVGAEVAVVEDTLHFRPAGEEAGDTVEMRYGETLLSFQPRLTAVQQVSEVAVRGWDITAKRGIDATSDGGTPQSSIGVSRDEVVGAFPGGTFRVSERSTATQEEADALAESIAARMASAYLEAEGSCEGDPTITAGGRVEVSGVGSRFSGTYAVSSVSHVLRGGRGFTTRFVASGQASRSLLDLVTPARPARWRNSSVVVGVVTQNEDPDGLGRVRVWYADLGEDHEGWWARIASVGAGQERGVSMMPQVEDEVLIAFEHDDPRFPYVVGSLWNGESAPGEDLTQADGSYHLRSDRKIGMEAQEAITITGNETLTLEITEGLTQNSQDHTVDASGTLHMKGQTVTLESSGSLTIKSSGSLTVQSSGTVSVKGSSVQLG